MMEHITREYDIVVAGGGLAGMIAAIAAAREGARTALVGDRPVLGGNASSEIRMHICGADHHGTRPDARETGILEEILLEHKRRNPENSWAIFDSVLWEKAAFQEGLDLYLNTHIDEVETEPSDEPGYERKIVSFTGDQITTEKRFTFRAKIFVDATGDATPAVLAGALYEKSRNTMGSSLMFKARDMGRPVPFVKPFWAHTYTEEDMAGRSHTEISSGYWWIELGGGDLDVISDGELIRDELVKCIYGVWDHIKNGGDHGAENYDLEWVGMLPGKRESRRLVGDYALTGADCLQGARFEDTVAYGGWPIDEHTIEGFKNLQLPPNRTRLMEDVYAIPYRCYYSKNIENLMMAGRDISLTPEAFASARVMATCAVGGQAVGTAAVMAVSSGMTPRELGSTRIRELQQKLIREDVYLPGVPYEGEDDPFTEAKITSLDAVPGHDAACLTDEWSRDIDGVAHHLQLSRPEGWIKASFPRAESLGELTILFDSNLSRQLTISLSEEQLRREAPGVSPELVKDFDLEFALEGSIVMTCPVRNNCVRFYRFRPEAPILCDEVRVTIRGTHGTESPKIFSIRGRRA